MAYTQFCSICHKDSYGDLVTRNNSVVMCMDYLDHDAWYLSLWILDDSMSRIGAGVVSKGIALF